MKTTRTQPLFVMPQPIRVLPLFVLLLFMPYPFASAQQASQLSLAASSDEDRSSADARANAARRVEAMRVADRPSIDGVLDEAVWQQAPPIDSFTQRDPDEGAPATERTTVQVIYDDEAIYIGAWLYDSKPDSIVTRLGRRDAHLNADRFLFCVDPYYDRRTGFFFSVNAAGTLSDGVLYNDNWDDNSWDGVWQGKAHIHDEGWSVEMRIPYSQLRFKEKEAYVWGVNFSRYLARRNELSYLVMTPRDESGFVSRFADMVGIELITPPRQIEVTPYVTAKAAFTDAEAGDPFNDGSRYSPDLGADFKVGITSNLTLNGTVNPDFGQVEVDPAVVNLSDVETFFPEKRPFFIEGASIFGFGFGGANSNWGFNFGTPDFFYSRRVGRAPQGSLPDYTYADVPDGVPILGAAKLTGKVGNGWNVGTMQALTARGEAELMFDGQPFTAEVEPRTYYGVVRAQREFQDGYRAIGGISTATVRSFGDDDRLAPEMSSSAYVGGLDGWTFLDRDREWVLTGWLGLSHVNGTAERIINLQRSSLHYFQRPDAGHVSVDSAATSLTGSGGRLALNKQHGKFYTNAAVGYISPGFELNDAGFMWRTDIINAHALVGYNWTEPRGIYRQARWNTSHYRSYDFDGNRTALGLWTNGWMQFKNYLFVYAGGELNARNKDVRATRGGPVMLNPAGYAVFTGFETDTRKKLSWEMEGVRFADEEGNSQHSLNAQAEWRPMPNMSFSVGPQISVRQDQTQYVGEFADPMATATFGSRYVFGTIEQTTVSTDIRLDWTFTPELSLQLFAQPLLSAGDYRDFKELATPGTYDFTVFGQDTGTVMFNEESEEYTVDPDGTGPAGTFSFSEPDFNFKSLRGTAVLRWEFRPGSTLYLVWTQTRDASASIGAFRFNDDFNTLIDARPDNIFVLKLTYWLSR